MAEYKRRESQIERHARDNLKAILDRGLGKVLPENTHFRRGSAYQEILEVADQINPDLLVIGSQTRVGIDGFLIGNTSEKVLRYASCEILTMKPNG